MKLPRYFDLNKQARSKSSLPHHDSCLEVCLTEGTLNSYVAFMKILVGGRRGAEGKEVLELQFAFPTVFHHNLI